MEQETQEQIIQRLIENLRDLELENLRLRSAIEALLTKANENAAKISKKHD